MPLHLHDHEATKPDQEHKAGSPNYADHHKNRIQRLLVHQNQTWVTVDAELSNATSHLLLPPTTQPKKAANNSKFIHLYSAFNNLPVLKINILYPINPKTCSPPTKICQQSIPNLVLPAAKIPLTLIQHLQPTNHAFNLFSST